jgi:hypothetical protein
MFDNNKNNNGKYDAVETFQTTKKYFNNLVKRPPVDTTLQQLLLKIIREEYSAMLFTKTRFERVRKTGFREYWPRAANWLRFLFAQIWGKLKLYQTT